MSEFSGTSWLDGVLVQSGSRLLLHDDEKHLPQNSRMILIGIAMGSFHHGWATMPCMVPVLT